MKKKSSLSNLGIGVLFTIFFIALGLVLVINFRSLYRFDMKQMNLSTNTGYSEEEIMANYNALIDYCSPFFKGELKFPTLPSSQSAISHFVEVKDIFVLFFSLVPITGVLLFGIILYKHKKRDYSYLFTSSITCIVLPALVGLACMINFDKTFVLFHRLVFNNDDWLFDPNTDPIILLLPEQFFMHCALFIVVFVLLGSLSLLFLYRRCKRHSLNQSF